MKNTLDDFAKGINIEKTTSKFATNINFKANNMTKKPEEKKSNQISKFCADFDDEDCINEVPGEDVPTPKLGLKHQFSIDKRVSIFTDRVFRKETFEDLLGQAQDDDDQSELSSLASPEKSPAKSPRKSEIQVVKKKSPRKYD